MHHRTIVSFLLPGFALLLAGASGCRGMAHEAPASIVDRVLPMAKGQGFDGMDEAAIAAALARPVELELPARVLVVDLGREGLGEALTDALDQSPYFIPVPAMRGIQAPPDGELLAHMRLLAVRYRTPYVVIAGLQTNRDKSINVLSPLYLALVTIPFLPGFSVEVEGTVEAALLDVRTGTLLFGVTRDVEARDALVVMGEEWDAKRALDREIAKREAPAIVARFEQSARRTMEIRTAMLPPAAEPKGAPAPAPAPRR